MRGRALPQSVVAILNSQRFRVGSVSGDERVVTSTQFTHENGERPAVKDEVVEAQNEEVLRCINARQHHAWQQWIGQGKGLPCRDIGEAVEFVLPLVNSEQLQIDARK